MINANKTLPTIYVSVADTAKEIRAAFKVAFPGIKFTVKSHSYSGGASIRVGWTDGPAVVQVNAVVARFEGAKFDGMQDLKTYVRQPVLTPDGFAEVHYGADYIFTERALSMETKMTLAMRIAMKFGIALPVIRPTGWGGDEFPTDMVEEFGQRCWNSYVRQESNRFDYSTSADGVEIDIWAVAE